jgi:lysozyme
MKYIRTHLLKQLMKSEGLRLEVYQDTLGIDTIGVGRNLEDRGITKDELDALDIPSINTVYQHGITEADAMYLLENDVQIVEDELVKAHPCVDRLDSVRQLVLVDMAFNMGVPRLCKFKKMWAAIHEEDFRTAAKEMLDSRWAVQVKSRSHKLAHAMHHGELKDG